MFKTIVRPKTTDKNPVEDLQDWIWPEIDHGSWGAPDDGPLGDWLNNHSKKWFEQIRRWGTVVQAGGNCGMYPRLLSDKFERVYTFEPHPLSFHCLVQNCQKDSIIKVNGALGPERTFIENCFTYEGADNLGMNTITKSLTGKNLIPMFVIDDMNLPNLDLLALDVEGFEYGVLCGGLRTIIEHKPVIILENGETEEIKGFLTPLDYRVAGKSVSDTIWAPIL